MAKRPTRDETRRRQVTATPGLPGEPPPADDGPLPALTIVSHPRADRAGEHVLLYALGRGAEVQLSRIEPDFLRPGGLAGEPLDDPYVSRKPVVLRPAPGGGVTVIAQPDGTPVLCGRAPVEDRFDIPHDAIARGVPLTLAGRIVLLLHLSEPAAGTVAGSMGMVGESSAIRSVRAQIESISDRVVPVLIRGENGTGKELVARAIHDNSPRRTGPFVAVNLGTLSREQAVADLFGARKGSYTGATQDRKGFFHVADGGTLFLDEVGEAPPDVQVMLLRVLQEGEMNPLGEPNPVPVDVRIIAATDADLEDRIRRGLFKEPLKYRLARYEIHTAPLRRRREDIGVLVHHFAKEELLAIGESHRLHSVDRNAEPWLPAALATRLVEYHWPGNIRELQNVVFKIVMASRGRPTARLDRQLEEQLECEDEAPRGASPSAGERPPEASPPTPSRKRAGAGRKPASVSAQELIDALRANAWQPKATAKALGISRTSLYDLIERSPTIRKAGDLSAEEIEACFHACGGDLDRMVANLEVSARGLWRRLIELKLVNRR